jgi:S1-C subfamily serine protease
MAVFDCAQFLPRINSLSFSMEKLVVTDTEVQAVQISSEPATQPRTKPPIPLWARLVMSPTVLLLPLLCLVSIVIRVALRGTAPRNREAWNAFLNTLLVTSSFLTIAAGIVLYSAFPVPPQSISAGLTDLDERVDFPKLPAVSAMRGVELSSTLKPLVMIATPIARTWFSRAEQPSGITGAALLLFADQDGYLFATARHVADGIDWKKSKRQARVLLTSGLGGWAAADVVGRHRADDVALLWVPRHFGSAVFAQPLADAPEPGSNVYVIGHPEGLNFSVSNGIVSRLSGDTVQISAPVSPGNSGGPVYDEYGALVGVVSSKMDRNYAPNAENLSFAIGAQVFRNIEAWEFKGEGQKKLQLFLQKISSAPRKAATGN